jgi:hypothetical protein
MSRFQNDMRSVVYERLVPSFYRLRREKASITGGEMLFVVV